MYTVADYLLDRLKELGIDEIFGVPGDYNLQFLDHITARKDFKWVGTANELNAAYMADGYARTKGIAAFVTTFGVGELSAVNGLAGSFAENVPVVEIVGSPTTSIQEAKKLVHHTLGDGNFLRFEKMHEEVTSAIAHLTAENALTEIDRVLTIALTSKRPVYINLPIDIADVHATKPQAPLNQLTSKLTDVEVAILSKIEDALQQAENPVIIAGHEILSYHIEQQLDEFIQKFNLPITTLPLGKSAFNEEDAHYLGTYTGSTTAEPLRSRVDTADLVLLLGVKLTDSATSGFSFGFTEKQIISIGSTEVLLYGEKHQKVQLDRFVAALATLSFSRFTGDILPVKRQSDLEIKDNKITQKYFWKRVEAFLVKGDTVVSEQGTSFFGMTNVPLKKEMRFIGQPLWGSIGYTFPSLLGSQIANKTSRHLLFIGDGSLQLTVQELGTALREKLTPIIFVINNNGYTVEREIHGATEQYNDIPMWDYQNLPFVFGGTTNNVTVYKVTTEKELNKAMTAARQDNTRLQWIEVIMDQDDAPVLLKKLAKIFAQQNS
ncbi:indole-3-pyruvate decarboxylase [Enterococcus ureilyticus]|uniref:Alpha-keto-acid decarboxylase n=1 Tax=Enterococcus ureilyticus TaxID=1131292 RepID=A0A1E5HG49_9ENTE|nr:alpha-keto acid decarboxylase family protein [Enterococcus ureilyticus]MBM7688051.1 indolepyruvate decarboxylase [Enterococcus ureilyticus]OEG23883.1 indole-3-pyruvate decarboxylase [Enterococcus ureilyticus]